MAAHYYRNESGQVTAIVTCSDVYRYKGFTFSMHSDCGPSKLNRDFNEAKRTGRNFWKVFSEWDKLTKSKKRKTLIAE